MAVKCFECGGEGHYAIECPALEVLDTRPVWCGICDRRTRLRIINRENGTLQRCHECHPTPNKPLAQHSRCPGCKAVVYKWDTTSECGKHQPVGRQLTPLPGR